MKHSNPPAKSLVQSQLPSVALLKAVVGSLETADARGLGLVGGFTGYATCLNAGRCNNPTGQATCHNDVPTGC